MRTPAGRTLPLLALIVSAAACGGAAGHASEPAPATETAGATATESSAEGGAPASPTPTPAATTASTEPAHGSATSAGTGPAATAAGANAAKPAPERPYASTAAEAHSLIDEQIRGHMEALWQCVAPSIVAGSGAHRKVAFDFRIDQDGRFISVMASDPKSKPLEPAAKACVADALRDAVFPRSKSVVTTVRETFTASATSGGS
jgi:hypothetical protein